MGKDFITHKQNSFFDKYLFRWQDIKRVYIKKILTKLNLRDKHSCKHCGRDQKLVWSVKNEIWNKLPKKYRNSALCIECFIEIHPYRITTDDITSISYVDPFRDNYVLSNRDTKKPKKQKSNRVSSLRELIDNEPPHLEEGMKYFCEKEKAFFILRDGEWVDEKHMGEDEDEDYSYMTQ